ncbi:MAG: pyruvate kinase [Acidobacteriota bacterium]|jgi:pyruvate kinase
MSQRRVRIVCTLGPASRKPARILALARAGMDVARLNFSHGDHGEHARTIEAVRGVEQRLGRPLAILADLAGPKIRVGEIPGGERRLRRGGGLTLSSRPRVREPEVVATTYRSLARDLSPGDPVLLDDGNLRLEVLEVKGDRVRCRVQEGGVLRSHKGINLPGVTLSAPALTARDRRDLGFALEHGVDVVALSFVRRSEDVRQAVRRIRRLRSTARPDAGRHPFAVDDPPLIAKLEKPEALEDLPAILDAAGGVMVARGDLGVEIPPERVPAAQKRIIRSANAAGRPVITATQMLESMTEHSRPTRAEASDVANAVLDGTDAVMLSAETAAGKHPVESVRMMDRIVRAAEQARLPELAPPPAADGEAREAVSRAAVELARSLDAAAIVAFTRTGSTALRLSRLRPEMPILVLSPEPAVTRRLALVWGLVPRTLAYSDRLLHLASGADRLLGDLGLARPGASAVFVMGYPPGPGGRTNLVKVHRVGGDGTDWGI